LYSYRPPALLNVTDFVYMMRGKLNVTPSQVRVSVELLMTSFTRLYDLILLLFS